MAFNSIAYAQLRELVSLADYCNGELEVRTRYASGDPCTCNCPACPSGTGPRGSAAFTLNPREPLKAHCFSCGRSFDVFDVAGAVHATDRLAEQAAIVAEWAGIDLDGLKRPSLEDRARWAFERERRAMERERKAREQEAAWEVGRKAEADRLARILAEPLSEAALAYLASRGVDEATAKAWHLGFDTQARRVVIPYPGSDYYHADRDVTGKAKHKYDKPKVRDVGPEPMFNPAALAEPGFVLVEGQLDALAVMHTGIPAVACGGVGLAPTLAEIKRKGGYPGTVLTMHDNDEPGRSADLMALQALSRADVDSVSRFEGWPEGIGDPFEWWQHDPNGLAVAIVRALCGGA